MADRINDHHGVPSYQGVGSQFEDNPKHHDDLSPQHVNNYLHMAPQTDEAKGKKENSNAAAREGHSKNHNDGFGSIDRRKVGNHKVIVQEVFENVYAMKRWRQDDHTSPWNNIEKVGKLEYQDRGVEGARSGHELAPSTAAVQGSSDAGL